MATGNKRILVVDDNKSLVMIVERVLQREGYSVTTALTGADGIQKAKSEKPDLIILDIQMPGGTDGYEVCRVLQLDPSTSTIPIIFLSSKGNVDERHGQPAAVGLKEVQLAFRYGASDFLHKPISANDLIAAVKNALSLSKILSSD